MSALNLSAHMSNSEIAELFERVADVLEIQSEAFFRIRAYRRAAENIRYLHVPLRQLWEKGELEAVGGIGNTFCEYLDELFRVGTVQHFEGLMKRMPAGMFPLIKLPGIGAKTAYTIAKTFSLDNPETVYAEVAALAAAGKLRTLERFGEKSEAQVLQAVTQATTQERRYFLPEAEAVAQGILVHLRAHQVVDAAETLGSLRRMAPTVGDIDIAVLTSRPREVVDHLLQYPGIKQVLVTGEKMTRFIDQSGIQVDVKTQDHPGWGSMLQHYTGSKQHNILLRTLAKDLGWSLSEHGMKRDGQLVRYQSEAELYEDLGLQWIPPELREARGEIEAARTNRLPELVQTKDIRGDLHMHLDLPFPTSHDMGASTIEQILAKGIELEYEYMGFTDHNPKSSGLTAAQRLQAVRERNQRIDEAVRVFANSNPSTPQVFKGLEVDIRPNGELAVDEAILHELDYVIVSIHSQFRQTKEETTARVLRALQHPKVRIWGHPTGRHLMKRSEVELDWEAVFAFCAEHAKLIEVNSSPKRLDLPDGLIHQALQQGVRFIVNTDAHHHAQLSLMRYGIATARRGWVEARQVANTLPAREFTQVLRGQAEEVKDGTT